MLREWEKEGGRERGGELSEAVEGRRGQGVNRRVMLQTSILFLSRLMVARDLVE